MMSTKNKPTAKINTATYNGDAWSFVGFSADGLTFQGKKSNDFFFVDGVKEFLLDVTGEYGASSPSISGGGGADQIIFLEDGLTGVDAITDPFFANTSSVEVVKLADGPLGSSLTLGDEAAEAGIYEVTGGSGNDTIVFLDLDQNAASMEVTAYSGIAVKVSGGSGDDFITTASGNDTIFGDSGSDTITGGAGNDRFVFTTALTSDGSTDTVTDYDASDIIDITAISNVLSTLEVRSDGNSGTQIELAGDDNSGFDVIDLSNYEGTVEFDITGQSGAGTYTRLLVNVDDGGTLTGTDDPEILVAGVGSQTITGGEGADVLTGGAGADTFVFAAVDAGAVNTGAAGDNTSAVIVADTSIDSNVGTTFGADADVVATQTGRVEVITDIAVGDIINLGNADIAAFADNLDTGVAQALDDEASVISGNYNATTGLFTAAAVGPDSVIIWDTDATDAAATFNAVILVGVTSAEAANASIAAGVVTF